MDDIFIIWTGPTKDFHTYMEKISNTEVIFLDTTVYKSEKFNTTARTHIKPTNIQLSVHASSYHPQQLKK